MIYIADHTDPLATIHFLFHRSALDRSPHAVATLKLTLKQLTKGSQHTGSEYFTQCLERLAGEFKSIYQHNAIGIGGMMLADHVQEVVGLWQMAVENPLFCEDSFANTQRVYVHELQNRYEDDEFLSYTWLMRFLYHQHPLQASMSSTPTQLQNVCLADVQALWPSLFDVDHFLPCISGDLTFEQAQQLTQQFVTSLHVSSSVQTASVHSGQTISSQPLLNTFRHQTTPATLLVHRPARQQAHIYLAQHSIAANHPDALALELAITALGGTFTSPLMQELRVKRGLSYSSYAYINFHAIGSHIYLHACVDAEDCQVALDVMLELYRHTQQGLITDEDIAFAQQYTIHSYPLRMQHCEQKMHAYTQAYLLKRPLDQCTLYAQYVQALSVEQIRLAARTHLSAQPIIVIMGDQELINDSILNTCAYPQFTIDALDEIEELDKLLQKQRSDHEST